MTEFTVFCLFLISGKIKILDQLGFIMQIHARRVGFLHGTALSLVTDPKWLGQWNVFESNTTEWLSKKDGIPMVRAKNIIADISQRYLRTMFDQDIPSDGSEKNKSLDIKKSIRSYLTKLPFLRELYHRYKGRSRFLHYDVMRPNSKYYADFQRITDSFTGKLHKS